MVRERNSLGVGGFFYETTAFRKPSLLLKYRNKAKRDESYPILTVVRQAKYVTAAQNNSLWKCLADHAVHVVPVICRDCLYEDLSE